MEDTITMADMRAIFSVTDAFGVDREKLRVELEKADPGSVTLGNAGMLEIVAPLSIPVRAWLPALRDSLASLGMREESEA
ncbi:MAG: hypothetical protein HY681_10995 [Chloroflexi bacterium]|nr:hypothetical protein [Chloroflexota bacterium]